MVLKFQYILIALVIAGVGCSKSQSVEGTRGAGRGCIPESELLATGIIGGPRVQENDQDSRLVAMILSERPEEKLEICTATLIAPKVLLTAAHCIDGTPDTVHVAFNSSLSCESGFHFNKTQKVAKVFVHDKYNGDATNSEVMNDIALVFLEEEAPEGYPVFKIADPDKVTDQKLHFYGYGVTGSKKEDSGVLRKTSIIAADYSIDVYADKIRVDQTKGRGICYGDSGGPAFVVVDNELQILGVNSFGRGDRNDICAGTSTLALVDSYRSWINSKIKIYSNLY